MNTFLTPKLVGERFHDHTVPLELLKDIAGLEALIIEIAKHCFREEHPTRQRVPRGFSGGVSMHLVAINEGSAEAAIALRSDSDDLFPGSDSKYFEQARNRLTDALAAAANDDDVTQHLPDRLLRHFDAIGRRLKEGEYIDFLPQSPERRAHLSPATRERLLFASERVQEITKEVALRGEVSMADKRKRAFQLELVAGGRVVAPLTEEHEETVLEAFNAYPGGPRVFLQGVGRYSRTHQLTEVESVEHISLLDPLDIGARLDELRTLPAGWLDGVEGEPLSASGLDWLMRELEGHYPEELPLPWLFPTAAGGVQAEWSIGGKEVSLDIDLQSRVGCLHILDVATEDDQEEQLELSSGESWRQLFERLQSLVDVEPSA